MTFQEFITDKKVYTDRSWIMRKCNELDYPMEDKKFIPTELHVYGNCHIIERMADGYYQIILGNQNPFGSLKLCEAELYFWVEEDAQITLDVVEYFTFYNRDNVRSFVEWCERDQHLNFHPDNGFEDYTHCQTDEPIYSADQAAMLNKKLEEAFAFCRAYDLDIYEIAYDVHKELDATAQPEKTMQF